MEALTIDDYVSRVLERIEYQYLTNLEWMFGNPKSDYINKSSNNLYIRLGTGAFRYAGMVSDMDHWTEEQIINHIHVVLDLQTPIKEKRRMATQGQLDNAKEKGSELGEAFVALNPSIPHNHQMTFATLFAKIAGFDDLDTGMAFAGSFIGKYSEYWAAQSKKLVDAPSPQS